MTAGDFPFSDGDTILVHSTRDLRNPPIAIRGSLKIKTPLSGEPDVRVVIDFPEMATAPAHQVVITLDRAALPRVKRNPHNGQLECTLDYDFAGETQDRSRVLPQAQSGQAGATPHSLYSAPE